MSSFALFTGVLQGSIPRRYYFFYVCLNEFVISCREIAVLERLRTVCSMVRTENGPLFSPTKTQGIFVTNSPPTVPLPILFLGDVVMDLGFLLRRFVLRFMLRLHKSPKRLRLKLRKTYLLPHLLPCYRGCPLWMVGFNICLSIVMTYLVFCFLCFSVYLF
jgi:hypothetical protein